MSVASPTACLSVPDEFEAATAGEAVAVQVQEDGAHPNTASPAEPGQTEVLGKDGRVAAVQFSQRGTPLLSRHLIWKTAYFYFS